jgi:hypothetical protein
MLWRRGPASFFDYHPDADLDADPAFYLMRIQVTEIMRIHADPDPEADPDPQH